MVANVIASFIAKKALSSAISQGQDGGKSRIRNVVDLSFPEIDAGLALGGDVTSQGLDSLGGSLQLAGASDVSGPLSSGTRAAPPAQLGTPTKPSSSKPEEPAKTTKTKQREQKKLETGTSPTDTAPQDELGELLNVFLDQKFENVKSVVSSLAALGRSDTGSGSGSGSGGTS